MQGKRTGMPAMSSSSTAATALEGSSVKIGRAGGLGLMMLLLSLILMMSSEPIVPMEFMCFTHGTEEIFFFGGTIALTEQRRVFNFYCPKYHFIYYLEVGY
jgi:hypothetical protein